MLITCISHHFITSKEVTHVSVKYNPPVPPNSHRGPPGQSRHSRSGFHLLRADWLQWVGQGTRAFATPSLIGCSIHLKQKGLTGEKGRTRLFGSFFYLVS